MTTCNPDLLWSCQIADSQVYEEYLTLTPVEAVPGSHDFVIRSRLDSARNPQSLHTRHRIVLTADAIGRIHRYLGDYLQRITADAEGRTVR